MNRLLRIETKLKQLTPKLIEIVDETFMHNGHIGYNSNTEFSHIKIIISDDFGDIQLLEKHRKIKDLLKDEFANGLHAVSIHLLKN